MRAVVMHRYGGPEVVAIEERPEPELGPRDVLIAARAASLNPIDYKLRLGLARLVLKPRLPLILGCDVSGVVSRVGAEVTRFAPGDEVFARLEKERMGALAERVAADESVVAKKPGVSFEEAASLPLAALTALQGLREVARLQPGQRVLIHAGAGGVGSLAIQLAKGMGAWVAATCSGRNVELVRGLGADEVVDYTAEDPASRLRDLDVVFDMLGGDSELRSIAMTRRGGVVMGIAGLPDAAFARDWLPWWAGAGLWFMTARRRRAAAAAGVRFVYHFMRPDGAMLAEIAAMVDRGDLRPLLHAVYPFEQVGEAFAELERGRARGKIVVRVA